MAKIIAKNNQETVIAEFTATSGETIGIQSHKHDVNVPMACGVGACRSCIARVESGLEFIDPEGNGPKQVPTEENEILMCLATIKENTPEDAVIEIVIENL